MHLIHRNRVIETRAARFCFRCGPPSPRGDGFSARTRIVCVSIDQALYLRAIRSVAPTPYGRLLMKSFDRAFSKARRVFGQRLA
jgi:hypothetical protein